MSSVTNRAQTVQSGSEQTGRIAVGTAAGKAFLQVQIDLVGKVLGQMPKLAVAGGRFQRRAPNAAIEAETSIIT